MNCQWASYVNCALGILGYEYDATLVDQLGKQKRNSTFPCHWLRFNIMAFRRRVTKNVAHQRLRRKMSSGCVTFSVGRSLHPSLRASTST